MYYVRRYFFISYFKMLNLKKNLFFIILNLLFVVFLTIIFYFFIYKNYFNFTLDSLNLLIEALFEILYNFSVCGYLLYNSNNYELKSSKDIIEAEIINKPDIIKEAIDYNNGSSSNLNNNQNPINTNEMFALNNFITNNNTAIDSLGNEQAKLDQDGPVEIRLSLISEEKRVLSSEEISTLKARQPVLVPTAQGCYVIANQNNEIRSFFVSLNGRGEYNRNRFGIPLFQDETGHNIHDPFHNSIINLPRPRITNNYTLPYESDNES